MGVAEVSRDHVEELLSELERQYDAFPVSQTTVTVSATDYERVVTRCREGVARVDVRVRNDDGEVLMVERADQLTLPGRIVENRTAIEREAQLAVHDAAGVDCSIEELDHATIAGVDSADGADRPTLYRLLVLFQAEYVDGTVDPDCRWRREPPAMELVR